MIHIANEKRSFGEGVSITESSTGGLRSGGAGVEPGHMVEGWLCYNSSQHGNAHAISQDRYMRPGLKLPGLLLHLGVDLKHSLHSPASPPYTRAEHTMTRNICVSVYRVG